MILEASTEKTVITRIICAISISTRRSCSFNFFSNAVQYKLQLQISASVHRSHEYTVDKDRRKGVLTSHYSVTDLSLGETVLHH